MLPRSAPLRQCARFDSRVRSSRVAASYKLLNNSVTVRQVLRKVSIALFHASMNASIPQESSSSFSMISTSFCRFFAAGPVGKPARHRRCIRANHTVTPCRPSFRAATWLSYSISLKVPGTPLAVPVGNALPSALPGRRGFEPHRVAATAEPLRSPADHCRVGAASVVRGSLTTLMVDALPHCLLSLSR